MIFENKVLGIYKGMAYSRCDDNGTAYYFSAKDFPGLQCEEYEFTATAGHRLQGYVYSYASPNPERLVVFDHGMGGGHLSYMKEIEKLCSRGVTVFAYDHTGCMQSGGENTGGMAQSLCDLSDCLNTIKNDPRFAGMDISVMGHSWGGFAAMNICALHPEVSHIVALAGFVSVERLVESFFGGALRGYRRAVMELERGSNPEFVEYDAARSLAQTKAKVLLCYSEDDPRCSKKAHYDVLHAALSGMENIRLLLVKDRAHNPNYTEAAVKYLGEYVAELTRRTKKKLLQTPEQRAQFVAQWDWDAMTAQNEAVWEEIYAALEL